MIKFCIALTVALLSLAPCRALQRTDMEFKIFQFPANMIPRIDGQTGDWAMVPESYACGTDQLSDTVMGHFTDYDRDDLDVNVRVGWVEGLNRLYFLYEAYDDYWNMYYRRGDFFEVGIDADLGPERWASYHLARLEGFEGISGWPNLTRGLVARGYTDAEIEGVLGGNWLRLFASFWDVDDTDVAA